MSDARAGHAAASVAHYTHSYRRPLAARPREKRRQTRRRPLRRQRAQPILLLAAACFRSIERLAFQHFIYQPLALAPLRAKVRQRGVSHDAAAAEL